MIGITKTQLRSHVRAFALATGAVLAVTSACSSSEERQRAIQLAGGCFINSDCAKLLICAFGRCHEECDEDRDCGDRDLRCVKSEEPGIFVCQLEDETVCKDNEHCPGEQVCGVDMECRDPCKDDGDCLESTQVCSASNECASTDPQRDKLDPRGHIIPFDPDDEMGAGGTAGTSGASATGGTGATSGTGGTAGTEMGGTTGSGGEPTTPGGAGDPATGGSGNEAGAPPDSDVDFEEPVGPEVVDNDTREKAVPIQTSAKLQITDNEDWLSYTAPDDGLAHVITLRFEQDAGVNTVLNITGGDFGPIGSAVFEAGETRYVYVTLGAGVTMWLKHRSGGGDGGLRITLEDVAEDDEHEPNNSDDAATPIALGQVVSGQVLAPFISKAESAKDDWFEVELAAGAATFELLTAPGDGRIQIVRQNDKNAQVPLGTTSTGAIDSFPMTNLPAGIYRFLVVPYPSTITSYAIDAKPKYLTEQYSFRITQ